MAILAIALGAGLAAFVADQLQLFVIGVPLVGVPLTARAPYVFGMLMGALLIVVGPLAAGLLRHRSAMETVVLLTVTMLALQSAALSALAEGAGRRLGEYVTAAVKGMTDTMGASKEMVEALVTMWPGALVASTGIAALLVVVGVGWVGALHKASMQRLPALADLDLDPRATLVPITAIALLAVGQMQGQGSWATVAGENVLVVATSLFFLQGMAVFAGLYRKANVPRLLRAFGYVLLVLTESVAPVVSLIGLADVWLNIRRLPRKSAEAGEPGAESGVD